MYVGERLWRGKVKAYSGDSSLLTPVGLSDVSRQGYGVFPPEYAGVLNIFCRHAAGNRTGSLLSAGDTARARCQLARYSDIGFPGYFPDRGNADRAGLCESQDSRVIPAKRCFSDSAYHSSCSGTDHRSYAGKWMDTVGAGGYLCPDCRFDAENVYGPFHL